MRKWIFIVTLVLIVGLLAYSYPEDGIDVLYVFQSIMLLIPLYGYSFHKKILNRGFAIGIFIWHFLASLLMFPFLLMGLLFGENVTGVGLLLFVAGPFILMFYTYLMYLYAFKSKDIWQAAVA